MPFRALHYITCVSLPALGACPGCCACSAYTDDLAPPERSLQAVLVDVEVKPGTEEAFRAATIDNARASMSEGGIHRYRHATASPLWHANPSSGRG